jgi:hypothetical protein
MTSTIEAPRRLGSREQAAEVLSKLPECLIGQTVVMSFHNNVAARPSFVDELVREILVSRNASCLVFQDPPDLVRSTALRSAESRSVLPHLLIESR